MADTTLNEYIGKRVFFVGIGGCSMSGLAKMLKWLGCEVAGSDRTRRHKTDALILWFIPPPSRPTIRSAPARASWAFRKWSGAT